jgi:hypothetical protein
MIAEVTAAFTSLNAAKGIIQGMDALRSEEQLRNVKIELQGLVLDAQQGLFSAQQEQTAATERIRALEAEIVRMKDWTAETQRYERADTGNGTIAYRLKAGMESGEPPHWLCPQCFLEGKPSILQPEKYAGGTTVLHRCNSCKTALVTRGQMGAVSAARQR